eukprot:1854889-Pleurochrysis_carterae.AAC.1
MARSDEAMARGDGYGLYEAMACMRRRVEAKGLRQRLEPTFEAMARGDGSRRRLEAIACTRRCSEAMARGKGSRQKLEAMA